MAIRTIEYTVSAGGILPSSTQRCGVQGEHNATMLNFNIDTALKNTLLNLTAGGGTLYYRFDAYDGAGAVIHYAATTLDLSGAVPPQFPLGNDITYSGGRVTVYLVITLLKSANGEKETEMELYSFPASVELAGKPDGTVSQEAVRQSLTTLAESARQSAENAKTAEKNANASKETAAQSAQAAHAASEEAARCAVLTLEHSTNADTSAQNAKQYEENAVAAANLAQNAADSVKAISESIGDINEALENALNGGV